MKNRIKPIVSALDINFRFSILSAVNNTVTNNKMTVKISVFAVVLIAAYVQAKVYQPPTLSMTMPPMPYYPVDGPIYNNYKKSLYTLNQALDNVCFSAQGAYDYFSLYKTQKGLNLALSEKINRFEKAISYYDDKLCIYRQELLKLRTLLGCQTAPQPMSLDDNISIDRDLL